MQRIWYRSRIMYCGLLPFSFVFGSMVFLRRLAYRCHLFKRHRFAVPIVIVGNLSVGGTGKTPCVIALVDALRKRGFKPGIISRGYGGHYNNKPCIVLPTHSPKEVGDEALLLQQRCQVPVIIGRRRVDAARYLIDNTDCDVIISDDGLQHYALVGSVNVVMIDGERALGNACMLPAGPLREPVSALKRADVIVITAKPRAYLPIMDVISRLYHMKLQPGQAYRLQAPNTKAALSAFKNQTVYAVAGIGHPQRFFAMLRAWGINVVEKAYPDHHAFKPADFNAFYDQCIFLTEKDAVKCRQINLPHAWIVPIEGLLSEDFFDVLCKKIADWSAKKTQMVIDLGQKTV